MCEDWMWLEAHLCAQFILHTIYCTLCMYVLWILCILHVCQSKTPTCVSTDVHIIAVEKKTPHRKKENIKGFKKFQCDKKSFSVTYIRQFIINWNMTWPEKVLCKHIEDHICGSIHYKSICYDGVGTVGGTCSSAHAPGGQSVGSGEAVEHTDVLRRQELHKLGILEHVPLAVEDGCCLIRYIHNLPGDQGHCNRKDVLHTARTVISCQNNQSLWSFTMFQKRMHAVIKPYILIYNNEIWFQQI